MAGVVASAVVWWLVYGQLIPVSEWLTALFPVARHSHSGEAIAFFFYDVPKVMLLLTLIVFAMGVVRTWFSPEKTRALLSGKTRRRGQRDVGRPRRCNAVLLLFGGPAVHSGLFQPVSRWA